MLDEDEADEDLTDDEEDGDGVDEVEKRDMDDAVPYCCHRVLRGSERNDGERKLCREVGV